MSKRKLHSVLDDGTEIFEYPDGALRKAGGQLFKRHPKAAPIFDKAGSALANIRKAEVKRHREETYQGEVSRILKKRLKAKTPEQAMAKLAGKQIDIALSDEERAADRLASTKYIEQAAGMSRKEQASGPAITLQMTPEAIDRMYALSMGVPEPPAITAEVRELEDAGAAEADVEPMVAAADIEHMS